MRSSIQRTLIALTVSLGGAILAIAQPPGIQLNPGETYVPGSLRDQSGNRIDRMSGPRPMIRQPNFENPRIYDTGLQQQGFRVDPYTGQIIRDLKSDTILESALDPNRDIVDPGSLRNVRRYETDRYGHTWLITGRQWTSYGRPHADLKRVRYRQNNGIVDRIDEDISYSGADRIEENLSHAPGPAAGSPMSPGGIDRIEENMHRGHRRIPQSRPIRSTGSNSDGLNNLFDN